MSIKIKPLTPDLLEDFLYYFDNVTFSDNPNWATCYCHFYHFNGKNKHFFKRTAEQNRNSSKELILSGKMNGLIAFQDDKPVGWCNVNSKENYAKIPYKGETRDSEKKIASIICFIIAPTHRRQGMARKILQYAASYLKNEGYELIEVYPRKEEKLSDAHSYRGPVSLYTSEGFFIHKKFKDYYVIRKNI